MTLKTRLGSLRLTLTVALLAMGMICGIAVGQETAEKEAPAESTEQAQQESQPTAGPELPPQEVDQQKQAEEKDQKVQQTTPPRKKTPAEIAREKSIAQEKIRMARVLRNRQAKKEHAAPWDGNWKRYKPYNSRASVMFPLHPKEGSTTMQPVLAEPPIESFQFMSTVVAKDVSFNFTYYDLHNPPQSKKKIQDTLNGAVTGMLARVSGEILMHEQKSYDKNAGREVKYVFPLRDGKGTIVKSWARIYLVGSRLYVQQALMPQPSYDDELCRNYLDSFVLLPTETKPTKKPGAKKTPPKTLGPGSADANPNLNPQGAAASGPKKK